MLNEAKILVYGEKAVPFAMKQLTWYSNPKLAQKRYIEFNVKKKNGSYRTIHAPVKGLKALQRTLSFILQCVFEPHQAAMGFVSDKSIVDNANIHSGSKYIYNIDLKDFFSSIDQARVWKCFQLQPINLNNTKPLTDLAVKDNPDIDFCILPNYSVEKNIGDIIWKMSFDGYRFPEGNFNLKLRDGGSILYRIEREKGSQSKGKIIVFVEKSRFEEVRTLANSKALKNNVNPKIQLEYIIWKFIEYHQKKLHEKNSRLKLANLFAAICCTEIEVERKNEADKWEKVTRNVLPQGAPTSPVITNIVCQRLDFLLSGVAKRFGLKYSRYADDITFSSLHNVYQPESDFIKELHRIIAEQGFHINENKTRLQKDGYRKEVTGLVVNERVNVQQRYIKQLRMWLNYWERYGYKRASGFFLQKYIADKGHVKNGKPEMANVISGKLDYLKMIKGENNDLYLKLKRRFNRMVGTANPINKVLDSWENEGIDNAMELYYK